MNYELSGKVDVSINGVTIPSSLLSGDDGVVTTLTETVREINTMAGTVRQATGTYEEAMSVFSVVLPNMNYLKNIFPDLYTASNDRPLVAGRVAFGGDDCTERRNLRIYWSTFLNLMTIFASYPLFHLIHSHSITMCE